MEDSTCAPSDTSGHFSSCDLNSDSDESKVMSREDFEKLKDSDVLVYLMRRFTTDVLASVQEGDYIQTRLTKLNIDALQHYWAWIHTCEILAKANAAEDDAYEKKDQ